MVEIASGTEITPGELRRIRLTRQSALIGTVSCGGFALGYAIAGPEFRVPMIANLIAVVCLLGSLVLDSKGWHLLARVAVLLPVNAVVVVASLLLGGRVGFVYYFFLFAAVAFLLFDEAHWWLRAGFALLSAAAAVYVRAFGPGDAIVVVHISPLVMVGLDVVSALVVMATVVLIVHLFTRDTARAEALLAAENERSEQLLLNILPASISTRLKNQGESIADGFSDVTVLFADIVGFTELSARLAPDELVRMLNRIFSAFDDLCTKLDLEKIKTIGDAYMVACGLPLPRKDHVEAIARMALGMRDALVRINTESGYELRIRIGIHTGPVVAGVIGKRKFIYDLWGDTVNTASRMESSGLPGEIQITREVYERLRGEFRCEARGKVLVKGKGEMETFLLLGEGRGEGRGDEQRRQAT